jgi:hypothetical protein
MDRKIKLSNAQKRIIQLMRDHGYLLVWNREYFFWEFKSNGKSVYKNVSSLTAQSLLSREVILEVNENIPNKNISYRLTELGKTIDLT